MSFISLPGSVQGIAQIPDDLKEVYRTAWEIDPLVVIDLAADRGPFIDQTQSMSLNVVNPTTDELVSLTESLRSVMSDCMQMRIQLHAWRRGLKTGMYYLRTQAPTYPQPYGVGRMSSAQESVGRVQEPEDNPAELVLNQAALETVQTSNPDETPRGRRNSLSQGKSVVEDVEGPASDEGAVETELGVGCVGATSERARRSPTAERGVSCDSLFGPDEDMVVCEGCSA